MRALRENGEREVRVVGTDMSERSVGGTSATHSISSRPATTRVPDAMREIVEREGVDVVLPQSSFDLAGTRGGAGRLPRDAGARLVARDRAAVERQGGDATRSCRGSACRRRTSGG